MDDKNYLIYKALADPHRIKIVEILTHGEECNCNIGEKLGMPLSTLAHHMKVLSAGGMVIPRKSGKWTYYKLKKEQLLNAKDIIDSMN